MADAALSIGAWAAAEGAKPARRPQPRSTLTKGDGTMEREKRSGMQGQGGREMDRMIDNWRGGMGTPFSRWPAIEMFDRDNDIVVRVELPGMKREDVHVRTLGDTL